MISYGRGRWPELELRRCALNEAQRLMKFPGFRVLVSRSRPVLMKRLLADMFYVCLEFYNHAGGTRFLGNRFVVHQVLKANGQMPTPLSLAHPAKRWDETYQSKVWEDMCRLRPRLNGRARAASVIARRWRAFQKERRERAARRIQAGCMHWIHKPRTSDGKLGINLRIIMKWRGVRRHGDTFLLLCKCPDDVLECV